MHADGSHVRQLTQTGQNSTPAWSPDGSLILFVKQARDKVPQSLYTIYPDGTHLRRLKTPGGVYDGPSWSPDGRAIALVEIGTHVIDEGLGPNAALVLIGGDGSGARTLWDIASDSVDNPEWAPDGRLISFVKQTLCHCDDWTIDLWTVRPDGSGARELVKSVNDAAWSPDGKHLVTEGDKLRIVSTDGKTEMVLKTGSVVPSPPRNVTDGPSWQTRCTVEGDGRGNRLRGGPGNDVVCGLGGADTITGGRGRDRLFGEEGNDTIVSRDGAFDIVGCGSGHDTVVADRIDLVGVDCERVERR